MFTFGKLWPIVASVAVLLAGLGTAPIEAQQQEEPFWADWDAFAPGAATQPAPSTVEEQPGDHPNQPGRAPSTDQTDPPDASEDEARLRFSFRFQPWSEVLNWFADQAGYSLVLDVAPTGTFNYTDSREYTAAEAIDLLNSVLVTKGYTLVLRNRMLLLVNLEDAIPPSLIAEVPSDELEDRGKFELLRTRFQLKNLTVDEAQDEIEELLGPQGLMIPLPKAQQLAVTETGGRLRTIRDVLEQAERSRDPAEHELKWFELHSVTPDEVVVLLRQMFDMPEDGNAMPDGSLRLATDPVGLRLLAAGKPERLEQVARMLETIDRPLFGERVDAGPQAAPQIEVYSVAPADPESVLRVMQTLLAESPGARLALDPRTDNLIAMARPSEHATIRATLEQMQRDAQGVEVIRLRVVDPHLAVLAINKLFAEEGGKPPSVDADPASRQLLLRGSAGQIDQIRSLLEKMGEVRHTAGALSEGKFRLVPVEGVETKELLEKVRQLWPDLHGNDLRIVPGRRAAGRHWIDERTPVPSAPDERSPVDDPPPSKLPAQIERGLPPVPPWPPLEDSPGEDPPVPAAPTGSQEDQPAGQPGKPTIFAVPTPEGLYISSDDTEALDRLEALIDALAGGVSVGQPKLTVFYLRHIQAAPASERLEQLLGGSGSPNGATDAANDTPRAAGILETLGAASAVGRITLAGPVSITPDSRLNALLVQALPADVKVIEQLLTVLDRPGSPEEVAAEPKPRLIPVVHTTAAEVADVVREVYQDRLVTAAGRMTPRQMMMRMLRRGREGRGMPRDAAVETRQSAETEVKMSIGVDERTNSVVVAAPEPLFDEVRQLVETLDEAASNENQTVQVLTLRNSNPETVRAALGTILGDSMQYGSATGTQRTGTAGTTRTRTTTERRRPTTRGTPRPTTTQRSRR